jgi:hypothetical protein
MQRTFVAGRWRWWVAGLLSIGCSTEPCTIPPCPPFEAVTITVTAPGGGTLPGLSVTSMGQPVGYCDPATCHVFGGAGDYSLTVTATGFASQDVKVKVTGEAAGCGTCGRVDTQHLSVTLSQASGE